MKSKTKFLSLHKRLLKEGVLDRWGYKEGLCLVVPNGRRYQLAYNDNVFDMVKPQECDFENFGQRSLSYWGSGSKTNLLGKYTPLRQNLILLCAAINGEL